MQSILSKNAICCCSGMCRMSVALCADLRLLLSSIAVAF